MEGITRQAALSFYEKLNKVSIEQSECTIYKVYRHLRDLNPKAYEPQIIAIGPYHHGKDHLKMMEDHKLRHLGYLCRNQNVEEFMSAIGPLELRARKCYKEPISLETAEFIEMLVLDGCFIIELLRQQYEKAYLPQSNDPIFSMNWTSISLKRDLMLLENQIPFFVLCKLYDLIVPSNNHTPLIDLLKNFFKDMYPGKEYICNADVSSDDTKHLLHLIHRIWSPSPTGSSAQSSEIHLTNLSEEKLDMFIKNATKLREANVKFKKREGVNLFEVKFEQGTIFMAPLTIDDRTESLFRNLIAYEQFFPNSTNYMVDYHKFLDCVIDSSKDIEILCHNGIVRNYLGDEEVVAKIVNNLGDSVVISPSRYAEIFKSVNEHCDKRSNKWVAKLRRNYLHSPWAIISVIAAIVLLLLTAIQTVFTILRW